MDKNQTRTRNEMDVEVVSALLACFDEELDPSESMKTYAKKICKMKLDPLFTHSRKILQYPPGLYEAISDFGGEVAEIHRCAHYLQNDGELIEALEKAPQEDIANLRGLLTGKTFKDLSNTVLDLYNELDRVCNGKAEKLIKIVLEILDNADAAILRANNGKQKETLPLSGGDLFYLLINQIFQGKFTYR